MLLMFGAACVCCRGRLNDFASTNKMVSAFHACQSKRQLHPSAADRTGSFSHLCRSRALPSASCCSEWCASDESADPSAFLGPATRCSTTTMGFRLCLSPCLKQSIHRVPSCHLWTKFIINNYCKNITCFQLFFIMYKI